MKNPAEVLKAALEVDRKDDALGPYSEAIRVLQEKGYSFRQIAQFLNDKGVRSERGGEIDHTRVYRFLSSKKTSGKVGAAKKELTVPSAAQYVEALKSIRISEQQMAMLRDHYCAHNRTRTYTELAEAIGSSHYETANMHYGKLGRMIGEAIDGFEFLVAEKRGEPFYSSSIGIDTGDAIKGKEYRLVMHHELAKAIESLGWFKSV